MVAHVIPLRRTARDLFVHCAGVLVISPVTLPKAPPVEHLPPMPPGVFTNYSPEPPGDAINIILLDTLNTRALQPSAYFTIGAQF